MRILGPFGIWTVDYTRIEFASSIGEPRSETDVSYRYRLTDFTQLTPGRDRSTHSTIGIQTSGFGGSIPDFRDNPKQLGMIGEQHLTRRKWAGWSSIYRVT